MERVFDFKSLAIIMFAGSLLSSCDNEDTMNESSNTTTPAVVLSEETAMNRFTEILSEAAYQRQDVRIFLKEEAIKRFDKNYDVLYVNVKNSSIGDETFHDILSHYSNAGELESIEQSVPALNIFIPKISAYDITPENMDCTDKEIPVVLPAEINNKLFLDGTVVDYLAKGEVPSFHVFVVNKNKRVVVNSQTRSAGQPFTFIDPEYDNSIQESCTRTTPVEASVVGTKAINAFSYFYKDDGSNRSKALQRDYIYYGLTPTSSEGHLNQAVTEYISFIEIDPKAYFMMTDKKVDNLQSDDPDIKQTTVSRKKRDFTAQELINELWTEGCYNLKIEMITSTSARPLVKRLALSPDDIWNFNLDRTYRHSTAFRHSKYTYTINPAKFTAKRYYLTQRYVSFGKWDLSNESLYREVRFIEEDPGETYTKKIVIETTQVNTVKVINSTKYGVGLGDNGTISTEVGTEFSSSTTTKSTKEITASWCNEDDDLGSEHIYFYDPIIESRSGSQYITREYNTGVVTFGVTAI